MVHEENLCVCRGPLQLQDCDVVGLAGAEEGPGDVQGLLGASGGPVPAHIYPVDPYLALGESTHRR